MKLWDNHNQPSKVINSPEKRLIAAVLFRALDDFTSGREINAYKDSAQEWIYAADDDALAPYGFVWCCDVLGIESDLLLGRIEEGKYRNREIRCVGMHAPILEETTTEVLVAESEHIEDGRRCADCSKVLPKSLFYKAKTTRDGLCVRCKPCYKKRYPHYYRYKARQEVDIELTYKNKQEAMI